MGQIKQSLGWIGPGKLTENSYPFSLCRIGPWTLREILMETTCSLAKGVRKPCNLTTQETRPMSSTCSHQNVFSSFMGQSLSIAGILCKAQHITRCRFHRKGDCVCVWWGGGGGMQKEVDGKGLLWLIRMNILAAWHWFLSLVFLTSKSPIRESAPSFSEGPKPSYYKYLSGWKLDTVINNPILYFPSLSEEECDLKCSQATDMMGVAEKVAIWGSCCQGERGGGVFPLVTSAPCFLGSPLTS